LLIVAQKFNTTAAQLNKALADRMLMRETPTIAENYPYGMPNSEIEKDIQEYSREINLNKGRPEVSACYAPLVQLGQAELQLRLAKKTFWISIFIGCFSLIVSCVALGLAYSANHSSDEWETRQIQLLEDINLKLEKAVLTKLTNDSTDEKPANKSIQPTADASSD